MTEISGNAIIIIYLIARSLTERARPKGMNYGMPGRVYLIARSLTERARPKGMYYGMPEWVYLIVRSLTERAHAKHLRCGMPKKGIQNLAVGIVCEVRATRRCSEYLFLRLIIEGEDFYGKNVRQRYH